jgi:hypothetical protein
MIRPTSLPCRPCRWATALSNRRVPHLVGQDRREHVDPSFRAHEATGKARFLHVMAVPRSASWSITWAVTINWARIWPCTSPRPSRKRSIPSGIAADLIDSERRIAIEKASEAGKPEAMIEKIAEGSVQKFLNEVTLLGQVFVKAEDGKQTIAQLLKAKGLRLPVSRCLWLAKASPSDRTTSPPKWLPRLPLPRSKGRA